MINVRSEGTLSIYSLRGALLKKINLSANGSYKLK